MHEKFRTIYVDPPWEFKDKLDKTRQKPYNTLTLKELSELPIDELSDNKAHLYLWTPVSFMNESLELIKAWNFEFKLPIVWLKLTKNNKIWFGLGHYFRNCCEFCLFAIKGGLKLRTNNTRNFFEAVKPNTHSGKPDMMYEIIESNSFGPYLELFAVKERNGWESWGYELDHQDIRNKIENYKLEV